MEARFIEILRRDQEERAGMGGLRQVVLSQVIGHPTGKTYERNERPGPLDGQPERRWEYRATFSDGSTSSFGLESRLRSIPAFA